MSLEWDSDGDYTSDDSSGSSSNSDGQHEGADMVEFVGKVSRDANIGGNAVTQAHDSEDGRDVDDLISRANRLTRICKPPNIPNQLGLNLSHGGRGKAEWRRPCTIFDWSPLLALDQELSIMRLGFEEGNQHRSISESNQLQLYIIPTGFPSGGAKGTRSSLKPGEAARWYQRRGLP
ncbi:hypothetical protein V8C43DRAFT_321527 [Trichoderma afarasin]